MYGVGLVVCTHPGRERLPLVSWGDGFSMRLKRPHRKAARRILANSYVIDKHLQAQITFEAHAQSLIGVMASKALSVSGAVQQ